MQKWSLSLILSALCLITTTIGVHGAYFSESQTEIQKQTSLTTKLLTHVRACIEFCEELKNKEAIFTLVKRIESDHCAIEMGNDDLRNTFVFAQGCFEHALACAQALGEIEGLVGVIHTPTIATPLCVKPDGAVEEMLDDSIRHDLSKQLTVRSRAQIIRDYLTKGGKLYAVYPKKGETKRTLEQLNIYQETLAMFPEHLIDSTLSCEIMDPDMIGATYFFRNPEGEVFSFSIQSRQANDIQNLTQWGIWFGSAKESPIYKRMHQLLNYLSDNNGPDLRKQFL